MKRTVVLSLCLAALGLTGGSALAADPASTPEKPGQICVVVWDDPNSSGRDGVCLVAPGILPKP